MLKLARVLRTKDCGSYILVVTDLGSMRASRAYSSLYKVGSIVPFTGTNNSDLWRPL